MLRLRAWWGVLPTQCGRRPIHWRLDRAKPAAPKVHRVLTSCHCGQQRCDRRENVRRGNGRGGCEKRKRMENRTRENTNNCTSKMGNYSNTDSRSNHSRGNRGSRHRDSHTRNLRKRGTPSMLRNHCRTHIEECSELSPPPEAQIVQQQIVRKQIAPVGLGPLHPVESARLSRRRELRAVLGQ